MKLKHKEHKAPPVKLFVIRISIPPTPYEVTGYVYSPDRAMVRHVYFLLLRAWDKLFDTEDVPNFLFARQMHMHRCSAEEWIAALRDEGYFDNAYSRGMETHKLREPTDKEQKEMERYRYVGKPQTYDPWKNRSWDNQFSDLWHPYFIDEIVDDYYSVYEDEYFKWFKERRTRPNGKPFRPMRNERNENDHPIDFLPEDRSKFRQKGPTGKKGHGRPFPPKESRKREISEACNGQTGKARKGEKTPQGVVRSWRNGKRFNDPSRQDDPDAGYSTGTRNSAKREGGIRRRLSVRKPSDAEDRPTRTNRKLRRT